MKVIITNLILILLLPSFGGVGGGFSQQLVQQEWVVSYPGPNNDAVGPYFTCDQNGNSYVAGTHVINDSINILCIKYKSSGVQQWVTLYKYPGFGFFAPAGIAIDSSGNAYITAFYSIDIFHPSSILTIKFSNTNGSVLWARNYTGQYNRQSKPYDIKVDRLNNIYVVGLADSSFFCLKYYNNGDSIWVRQYHAPRYLNYAYACTIDDSLNIIITGENTSNYYTVDSMITIKYNTNGIFSWEKSFSYSTSVDTRGTKIVTDQYGNIFVGGSTWFSGVWHYLTVKYDKNGNLLWNSFLYGSNNGNNVIKGIEFDKINNFLYVTGYAGINNISWQPQ